MKTAKKLRKFRQQCECEAGISAHDIEVPLSSVLDDVCRLLSLPARTRRSILGRKNYTRIEDMRVWKARLIPEGAADARNGQS